MVEEGSRDMAWKVGHQKEGNFQHLERSTERIRQTERMEGRRVWGGPGACLDNGGLDESLEGRMPVKRRMRREFEDVSRDEG